MLEKKRKKQVFASREPAMRAWSASCIDIACKPLVINQSWLYDRHLNTAMMKETLVEVLNEYPTLSGRISDNSIICNNAGVLTALYAIMQVFFGKRISNRAHP